jgi:hypothetical protein
MSERAEVAELQRWLLIFVDGLVNCTNELSDAELNEKLLPTTSSLGMTTTHIFGNLQQNVLDVLGGEPYARNRDAEFQVADATGAALREQWAALRPKIEQTLSNLPDGALDKTYEHPQGGTRTGRDVLVNCATHAGIHFGEAELTRDLLKARRQS